MAEAMDSEAVKTFKRKTQDSSTGTKPSAKKHATSASCTDISVTPFEALLCIYESISGKFGKEEKKDYNLAVRQAQKYVTALEERNKSLQEQIDLLKNFQRRDDAIQATLNQLTQRVEKTATTIEQSASTIERTSEKPSYSKVAQIRLSSSLPTCAPIQPPRNVLAVYPGPALTTTSSNDTKNIITTNLQPRKDNLQIRKLKPINNHGILIETQTRKDLDAILNSKELEKAGLTAGLPAKKLPHIIIYSIPNSTPDAENLKSIHLQNFHNLSEKEFNDSFKLRFKTGSKSKPTSNWVIQISPSLRSKLNSNRIFIGYDAHHTKDFVPLSRCFKCQCFGHVSKYCQAKQDTCGHCGLDGHSFKECPSKSKNPICINCKRANKPHDHSNRANDCPAYKAALEICLKKIDYGQ